MGMTDAQFKAYLRFMYDAIEEAENQPTPEKREEKIKKILDNIRKSLED